MAIAQDEFQSTIEKFSAMENIRDQLWHRARRLLQDGYDIEAIILILATWNFARFRFIMKELDLEVFQEVMDELNPLFAKLEDLTLQSVDLDDDEIKKIIKTIYGKLKSLVEQTGASKTMALKNPSLFPPWDQAIRKKYKIPKKTTPEDYIEYLEKLKDIFIDPDQINWEDINKPIAKAIDEYNYVEAEEERRKKRKLKGKKK